MVRAQTFSTYKHYKTIKSLVGISSQGTISLTSEALGGRTSGKFFTEIVTSLETFNYEIWF